MNIMTTDILLNATRKLRAYYLELLNDLDDASLVPAIIQANKIYSAWNESGHDSEADTLDTCMYLRGVRRSYSQELADYMASTEICEGV